jgi:hypothetical protein
MIPKKESGLARRIRLKAKILFDCKEIYSKPFLYIVLGLIGYNMTKYRMI